MIYSWNSPVCLQAVVSLINCAVHSLRRPIFHGPQHLPCTCMVCVRMCTCVCMCACVHVCDVICLPARAHMCMCVHVFVSGCVYQSQYMDASHILATHHHTCTPQLFLVVTTSITHNTFQVSIHFRVSIRGNFPQPPTHLLTWSATESSQGSKQRRIVYYITSLINLTLYSIPVYIILY